MADDALEPWALADADRDRGVTNDSVEAVFETEGPRESEQAVGVAGRTDREAGAPADGQSPPLLEER